MASESSGREHQPVEVPADDGQNYRDIDNCEGCGARGASLVNDQDGVALRAIKMREGRRRMLCRGCFAQEVSRGTVSRSDPRIEGDSAGGSYV